MLVKYAFTVLASALVVVTPWHVYTYRTFHTFSFLPSSAGGSTLYYGNNPDFLTYYPYLDIDRYAPFKMDLLLEHQDDIDLGDPVEIDRFFKREAWTFISENPVLFIKSGVLKLVALYSPLPTALGTGELVGQRGDLTLKDFRVRLGPSRLPHLFLMSIVLSGVALFLTDITLYTKRQKIQIFFIIGLVVVVTLLYMLFYGQTRFRLPLDPLLIILAGEAYSRLVKNRCSEDAKFPAE